MQKAKFTYPNDGTPDSYPDYTAHSGQVVEVIRQLTDEECHEDFQPMYLIRAADGWEGHVDSGELEFLFDDDDFGPFSVEKRRTAVLRVNCPEVFKDQDFLRWLNDIDSPKFTWHASGEEPHEFSDVMVTYDNREGSNSDMPPEIWDWLCHLWQQQYGDQATEGLIWMTNLEENPLEPTRYEVKEI